jgi:hypothetical protein
VKYYITLQKKNKKNKRDCDSSSAISFFLSFSFLIGDVEACLPCLFPFFFKNFSLLLTTNKKKRKGKEKSKIE